MPQVGVAELTLDGCNYGVMDVQMPGPGGVGVVDIKQVTFEVPRDDPHTNGVHLVLKVLFTKDAFDVFCKTMQSSKIALATEADLRVLGNGHRQ